MTMPLWQGIATVAAVVLGTLVTRFLPTFLKYTSINILPQIRVLHFIH